MPKDRKVDSERKTYCAVNWITVGIIAPMSRFKPAVILLCGQCYIGRYHNGYQTNRAFVILGQLISCMPWLGGCTTKYHMKVIVIVIFMLISGWVRYQRLELLRHSCTGFSGCHPDNAEHQQNWEWAHHFTNHLGQRSSLCIRLYLNLFLSPRPFVFFFCVLRVFVSHLLSSLVRL